MDHLVLLCVQWPRDGRWLQAGMAPVRAKERVSETFRAPSGHGNSLPHQGRTITAFDRQGPFIQETTLLYLDLWFFRIVKEGGREIRWVVHRVAMLPIRQVMLDDLHEGGGSYRMTSSWVRSNSI
jgi:hypothetical protein